MENHPMELMPCDRCRLAKTLQTSASALNQSLHIREVLDTVLESAGQVVPNEAANIMLIEGELVRVVACKGDEVPGSIDSMNRQARRMAELPSLMKMVQSRQPIVVSDTKNSPDWVDSILSHWVRSYTSAPIMHQGKVLGFLTLTSSSPAFYTSADAVRLGAFAAQAAVAINNAYLFEAAQKEIAERKLTEEVLQKANAELETRVKQCINELHEATRQHHSELERRQKAEAALEKEHASLERKIIERTTELSNANIDLEKAAQMKDAFLASMSHELRTPLNSVINISETMQEQVFGDLNPKQLLLMRTIEESGRHLLALITDILDLSKIGAGKLKLEWDMIPVIELCESSLKMIEETARKKSLTITTSFDPNVNYIRGDYRRLKQVLVNLLNNAVKYALQGGLIGLEVRGDQEKQQVFFSVLDNGMGISEENINLLFKPFTQLDSGLSRQYDSSGLGLALTYHLVEMHGGSIEVESKINDGSRFTVILGWNAIYNQSKTPDNQESLMLSYGDDQGPGNRIARLTRYLNELTIEVTTHWIGTDLAETSEKLTSGIVIFDAGSIGDPEKTIHALWEQGHLQQTPTLILSNKDDMVEQFRSTDRIGVLHFPFTRQELRGAIKHVSPQGTASLINRAVIFRSRTSEACKNQASVLIIDDNVSSVQILSEYLEMNGFQPVIADNGFEAVERARELRPVLILVDVQMPKMDGLEAIRRIRRLPEIQKTPVVALTALAMPGDRKRCLDAGADYYVGKPITLKMFLEIIDEKLQNA